MGLSPFGHHLSLVLQVKLSLGGREQHNFRIIKVVLVRNVTEKRAHSIPHLSANYSTQNSESFDEFTEKNNFLLLSAAVAERAVLL